MSAPAPLPIPSSLLSSLSSSHCSHPVPALSLLSTPAPLVFPSLRFVSTQPAHGLSSKIGSTVATPPPASSRSRGGVFRLQIAAFVLRHPHLVSRSSILAPQRVCSAFWCPCFVFLHRFLLFLLYLFVFPVFPLIPHAFSPSFSSLPLFFLPNDRSPESIPRFVSHLLLVARFLVRLLFSWEPQSGVGSQVRRH